MRRAESDMTTAHGEAFTVCEVCAPRSVYVEELQAILIQNELNYTCEIEQRESERRIPIYTIQTIDFS